MRKIDVKKVEEAVYEMFLSCCVRPDPRLKDVLAQAKDAEGSAIAKSILTQLELNIDAAQSNNVPLCQDTGMAVVFFWISDRMCTLRVAICMML